MSTYPTRTALPAKWTNRRKKQGRKLGDFCTLPNGALMRVYAWRTNENDCHGYCKAHPGCGFTRAGFRRYACGVIVRQPKPIAARRFGPVEVLPC